MHVDLHLRIVHGLGYLNSFLQELRKRLRIMSFVLQNMPGKRGLRDAESAAVHVAREVATKCIHFPLIPTAVSIMHLAPNGTKFLRKPELLKVTSLE